MGYSKQVKTQKQIEKWRDGNPKKLYLYWELYNLFNRIDPNRKTASCRIRHSNLYRSYCKADSSLEKMNILCLNPFHYEMIMELNVFSEQLTSLITRSYEENISSAEVNTMMVWSRDIHKFIEWGPNCSPQKYLEIIGLRLASLRGKDFTEVMNFYCKKLRFFGLSKQPCVYYIEKTPREKIREFEKRLVQFCRPEVYKKLSSTKDSKMKKVKWSCDDGKTSRYW